MIRRGSGGGRGVITAKPLQTKGLGRLPARQTLSVPRTEPAQTKHNISTESAHSTTGKTTSPKTKKPLPRGFKEELILKAVDAACGADGWTLAKWLREFVSREGYERWDLDQNIIGPTLLKFCRNGLITRIQVKGKFYYFPIDKSYKENNGNVTQAEESCGQRPEIS